MSSVNIMRRQIIQELEAADLGDNERRAYCGQVMVDLGTDYLSEPPEEIAVYIADAMANLLHLCDRHGIGHPGKDGPDEIMVRALRAYEGDQQDDMIARLSPSHNERDSPVHDLIAAGDALRDRLYLHEQHGSQTVATWNKIAHP